MTPAFKALLDAAATTHDRKMNAEIVARLQWSFENGYHAGEQTAEAQKVALDAIQASPVIRLEKRLLATEAELEGQMEALKARVDVLEKRLEPAHAEGQLSGSRLMVDQARTKLIREGD